ncbi:ABC transporter permease [Novosphingobium colocasiae]|uniref:ABC transporter permease n=1 Tax=Novosphingobium colocasiae TaxID=1256513 RepID=UPI0035B20EC3
MTPPAIAAAARAPGYALTPDGTTIALPLPQIGPGDWRPAGLSARLRTTRPAIALSALFCGLLAIAALTPGLLTAIDPQAADANLAFLPPDAQHWLGTDENGRDVLARLIHGTGASLGLGIAAMAISLVLGTVIGIAGGLGGRAADATAMRFADVMAAIPNILFALLVITLWGQSTTNVIVAIGLATMPRYARLVRTTTRTIRAAPFVEAATTLGLRRATVIWRHILPNAVKPALLLAVIGIGDKIAFAAALSFLGFGSPPPAPEWGAMLAVGRNFVSVAPWLVAAPAVIVTLTVLAVSTIGREIIRRGEGKAV